MTVLRECWHRLWGAFRRNPADHDLERELRFHLEQAEEELRAKGHSPAEAARMARVRLGGVPQTMEALRDQRGLPWLDDLRIDLRIGLRGLARQPGFTATAVLTLSIGIGATAAVATVANPMFFQPLPVPDPDELVSITQLDEHTSVFPHPLSYPEYLDYRERNDVFEGLAAHAVAEELLSIEGRAAERIQIEYVSDNYFDVLQLNAVRGRTFLPGEGRRPGDAPFVVLSHHAWRSRFGGDPAVIGQVVRLGPANMTVIGIMPEDFIGTYGLVPTELFVPATAGALIEPGWTDLLTDRLEEMFAMTGRLRPGVTLGEAAAQLDILADALAAEHPDASAHTELYVIAERYARPEPGAARHTAPLVSVVMGLASLVLLVAMANVGTLLVARGCGTTAGDGSACGTRCHQAAAGAATGHRERAAGAGGRRRRRDRRGVGRRSLRRLLRHGRWTGTGTTRLPRGLAGVRVHRNDGNGGRGAHRTRAGVALDADRVGARHRLRRP